MTDEADMMHGAEPSPPGFHGRVAELAWLRGLFEETARERTPRLAVIVAESGLGKSRLVQALYQQLSVDPRWDPEAFNYWPDDFQEPAFQLAVNPRLNNHVPKGPPQFMWLGMRWQDPDRRNFEERTCPLPEARDAFARQVALQRAHGPAWKELIDRMRDSTTNAVSEEGVTVALDFIGIPFQDAIRSAGSAFLKTTLGRMGPRGHDDGTEEKRDAGDELVTEIGKLMRGKHPLPTVLWLDDAQWIDSLSVGFIRKLLATATRGNWPLLIVTTHWEREWREGILAEQAGEQAGPRSLAHFAEHTAARVKTLDSATNAALRALLLEHLPGLTQEQQDLLLEKAAGNFLTMTENIGELRRRDRNFEDRDRTRPLVPSVVDRIRHWESDRDRRVQQRFDDLEEEIQDLLGWGSQMGHRFIAQVIADFAERRSVDKASDRIRECVDPYAILCEPNPLVREFRDRAFHRVAATYFAESLADQDEDDLTTILREHLARWTNACFDDDGELLAAPGSQASTMDRRPAPQESVMALDSAERLDLLSMAVGFLPIPETPDWTDPEHVAALRASCLLVRETGADNLWDRCREEVNTLEAISWTDVPVETLSITLQVRVANDASTAGSLNVAHRIRLNLLEHNRGLARELATPESQRNLSVTLGCLGNIDYQRGNLDAASTRYVEAHEIDQRLARELGTPESQRDLSVTLDRLGNIDEQRGNLDAASTRYLEALEIHQRLARELGTPESQRDLSFTLGCLGNIDYQRGNLDAASTRYVEALEIHQRLARELGTPESQRGLSVTLVCLGHIDEQRGNLNAASTRYVEALEIRQRLARELGTPVSQRDLSFTLGCLGNIDYQRGNLDAASTRYVEAHEIDQRLARELATPASQRDLSVTLGCLGNIDYQRGNLDAASTRYVEALEIDQRLARELATPASQRDLSVTLGCLGNIDYQRGNLDAASTRYVEALEIRQRLARELGTPESQRGLSVTLGCLGNIDYQRGNLDAASTRYVEALEIRQRLARELGTPESQRGLSVTLGCLGHIDEQRGNLDAASTRYVEALEIHQRLARELGTPASQRDLSVTLDRLGNIDEQRGNLDAASTRYVEALEIHQRLARELGTPVSQRDLSITLGRLGHIDEQRGNLDAACSRFEEAISIQDSLAQQGFEDGDLLRYLLKSGIEIARKAGHTDQADAWQQMLDDLG